MSRSRRHVPIHGIAGGSEKADKRRMNRILRRASRAVAYDPDAVHMVKHEAMDVWSMQKDGKVYWARPESEEPWRYSRLKDLQELWERMMRK